MQPIKEWPESDRPREKLLEHGPESLSPAELLAIILRTGEASTGQSALDHGRELMTLCENSFRMLADASTQELCTIKGIGPAKAAQIKAAILGPSEMIPVQKGRLTLGTWQAVLFVELDGPRDRKVIVTVK